MTTDGAVFPAVVAAAEVARLSPLAAIKAAVAKKFTDPPMKEAVRQDAATTASDLLNSDLGPNNHVDLPKDAEVVDLENRKNDATHPITEPTEASKNGSASRRIADALPGMLPSVLPVAALNASVVPLLLVPTFLPSF